MTPNSFDDFNNRQLDLDDKPTDDNLVGADPLDGDNGASNESTLDDEWGPKSDALGG